MSKCWKKSYLCEDISEDTRKVIFFSKTFLASFQLTFVEKVCFVLDDQPFDSKSMDSCRGEADSLVHSKCNIQSKCMKSFVRNSSFVFRHNKNMRLKSTVSFFSCLFLRPCEHL